MGSVLKQTAYPLRQDRHGEATSRWEPQFTFNQEDLEMSTIMKKTIKYIIAALVVAGVCVVLFSFIGVGVFLLPLVGGAFAANK